MTLNGSYRELADVLSKGSSSERLLGICRQNLIDFELRNVMRVGCKQRMFQLLEYRHRFNVPSPYL